MRRPAVGRVIAAAVAFYAVFVARTSFALDGRRTFTLFDDAMISMTYARNLARGHGLVWNAGGTPVEGITNPLWTLVMAVPHALGVPENLTGLFMSAVAAACLVGCTVLARELVLLVAPGDTAAAAGAAWMTAFCYPLVYWSLRGMEVGLVTVLVLAGTVLTLRVSTSWSRRDQWLLAAACVALVSTRLDTVVYVTIFCLYAGWRLDRVDRARTLATVGGFTVGAVAAQELWRHAYYGAWVPNTYTLKVAHVPLFDRLARGGLGLLAIVLVSMTALLVSAYVAIKRRRGPGSLLLGAIPGAGAAYSVIVGGDAWEWMHYANRYLVPGVVVLCCLAAIGAGELASLVVTRPRVGRMTAGALTLGAVGVAAGLLPDGHNLVPVDATGAYGLVLAPLPVAYLVLRSGTFVRSSSAALLIAALAFQVSGPALLYWLAGNAVDVDADETFARYGALLGSLTEDDATVAVVVAGMPIYFADRTGIDLLGKSDPRIAALGVRAEVGFWPGHSKWDYDISILHDRPDVVAQLRLPSDRDLAAIRAAGYVEVRAAAAIGKRFGVRPAFFVRADSDAIRWDLVERVPPTPG